MSQLVTKQELAPVDESAAIISVIERVVMNPDIPIDRLEKMLEMQETVLKRQERAAYNAALVLAMAEMPAIPLNGTGHQSKKYAMLKDIVSITRPVLSKFGLALTFDVSVTNEVVISIAELSHKLGFVKRVEIHLPRDASGSKNAVQAVGSSQTYGQRYSAQAILGLSLGDDIEDDGRSSGKPTKAEPKKQWSWADALTEDLPETATLRDKAEAVAAGLCAQFKRMKGERQMSNEWDRRANIINGLEDKHKDLWENVIDAYENQLMKIKEDAK